MLPAYEDTISSEIAPEVDNLASLSCLYLCYVCQICDLWLFVTWCIIFRIVRVIYAELA